MRSLAGFDERSPSPRSRRQLPVPWVVVIIEFGPAMRERAPRRPASTGRSARSNPATGIDVGALARELGCSHKHLIALFQDQVGIPPKLLASLVRFDAVVGAARMRSGDTWSALAITHGYFDQAHLARDVRRFAGLTPTEVRALAR